MRNKATQSAWIEYRRAKPEAHLRLFCIPYAGGGASIFRTWTQELPPDIEVCPIQLPGRESRLNEQPFTSLDSLIPTLMDNLLPYLDRPFAFFGYSMGALIGFELARQFSRDHNLTPLHLFVAAHRAPQLPSRYAPLHQLPESAFLRELRRLNGTPGAVLESVELMELLLPLLRADFTVCETYIHRKSIPLHCNISAFGGLEDTTVFKDELIPWQEHTLSKFTLRMLPGDHFFLNSYRASLLQAVAKDISHYLKLTHS